MERIDLSGHLVHVVSMARLRRVADRACRLNDLPPVKVYARVTGDRGSYGYDTIQLDPRQGRNLLTLAHELAHHFVEHKAPRSQDHGPRWVRFMGQLLDAFHVIPIEGYRAVCRRRGVRS